MEEPIDLGRRRLLTGAAAAAVGLLVGCGDDGSDPAASPSSTSTTRAAARLPGDPFTLGVASGDPLADRVVLWTRLAVDPLAADGAGGMPAEPLDVEWEVAADEGFARVVRSGVATAAPDHGHAVHVDVDGLDPATEYHYRFRVGDFASPAGRTRTLPDGSPARFALVVLNCQWLETGAYGAYRNLLDEDVDLVVHLGDYIYEYAGIAGPRMAQPAHVLETLADYRLRYASYRLDPHLAAAHARFPFCLTWDDHEVSNNYAGDALAEDPDPEAARARKAAAYQAWWEHLPVRVGPPEGAELTVHQSFAVGDLARLVLLDERQHADLPPCRGSDTASDDYGDCAERLGEDRSILSAEQEAWFAEEVARGDATWTLVGNPVTLAGVDAGSDTAAYYLDSWDGFPAARERLIAGLASASNPVVLTGDYHAGMVLDVRERPFEDSPVVATELMAPPVSSPLFAADVSARTPHLRQQLNAHGYLAVVVEPEQLTASFRVLDDVQDENSLIRTAAEWRVRAGSPVAEPVR